MVSSLPIILYENRRCHSLDDIIASDVIITHMCTITREWLGGFS